MENCRCGGTSRVEIRCKDTTVFHMVRAIVDDSVRLRAIMEDNGVYVPKTEYDTFPLLPPLSSTWMAVGPQNSFQTRS